MRILDCWLTRSEVFLREVQILIRNPEVFVKSNRAVSPQEVSVLRILVISELRIRSWRIGLVGMASGAVRSLRKRLVRRMESQD